MPENTAALAAADYFAVIPEWVLDHPDLSDRAVRLYGVLRRYADQDGQGAMPSRQTLAGRLRCSLDSVDRALKELKKAEAVTWQRRYDPAGDPTSSLYTVMTAAPTRRGSRSGAATGSPQGCGSIQSKSSDTEDAPAARSRNPWWDAIVQAVYPGERIPDHQRTLAGKLAARAEKAGHPPERILAAAGWIVKAWGPEKLTLPSLVEHYERASGALAQDTRTAARLAAAADSKGPKPPQQHVHQFESSFGGNYEICTVTGCPAKRTFTNRPA